MSIKLTFRALALRQSESYSYSFASFVSQTYQRLVRHVKAASKEKKKLKKRFEKSRIGSTYF